MQQDVDPRDTYRKKLKPAFIAEPRKTSTDTKKDKDFEIAITQPNHGEVFKCRNAILRENPWRQYPRFDDWKNIPLCLVDVLKNMAQAGIESDEFHLDVMLKVNERFYRLQK